MSPQLDRDGYLLLRGVLDETAVAAAAEACAAALAGDIEAGSVLTSKRGAAYGARNLLQLWPAAVDLLRAAPLAAVLREELGPRAGVVRGLYFDKVARSTL